MKDGDPLQLLADHFRTPDLIDFIKDRVFFCQPGFKRLDIQELAFQSGEPADDVRVIRAGQQDLLLDDIDGKGTVGVSGISYSLFGWSV